MPQNIFWNDCQVLACSIVLLVEVLHTANPDKERGQNLDAGANGTDL